MSEPRMIPVYVHRLPLGADLPDRVEYSRKQLPDLHLSGFTCTLAGTINAPKYRHEQYPEDLRDTFYLLRDALAGRSGMSWQPHPPREADS